MQMRPDQSPTVKDVQPVDAPETKRTNFVQLVEQHAAGAAVPGPSKNGRISKADRVPLSTMGPQSRGEVQIPHLIGGPELDADDYQRQHDDIQPAEHWNAELGEFVTAPSYANRPASRGRPARPLGAQGARASPAALTPQLLALASTIEHESLIEQKADHAQDTA